MTVIDAGLLFGLAAVLRALATLVLAWRRSARRPPGSRL